MKLTFMEIGVMASDGKVSECLASDRKVSECLSPYFLGISLYFRKLAFKSKLRGIWRN
jgi:hypothetical protein